MSDQPFEGWAVVEVMGHRKVAGFCDHVRVAGVEMLRVSPPGATEADPDGEPDILSAAAIFAVHPCDEETVRRIANPVAFTSPQLTSGYEPEPDDPDDWDEEEPAREEEDLLPCPFCKSFDLELDGDHYVCQACMARGPLHVCGVPLADRWNTRGGHVWKPSEKVYAELAAMGADPNQAETDDAGRESDDDEPGEPPTDNDGLQAETASEGQAEPANADVPELVF